MVNFCKTLLVILMGNFFNTLLVISTVDCVEFHKELRSEKIEW